MALLEQWRKVAYNENSDQRQLKRFWDVYFEAEKGIYAQLLAAPDEVVSGSVKELADKYDVSVLTMTGFLDGINDSLVEKNPIEEMEEDTQVTGFIIWSSGMPFLTRKPERRCIRSRNLPPPS